MAASFALLVAAIDFGTTYSSWGFSFRHEFESDPTKVFTKKWSGNLLSEKVPTCILIEPDGRTLHSFGLEAEKDYGDLMVNKAHEDWYFFERFKMKLYENQKLGRGMMLEDISGKKSLPAKTVFSLSIKFMKDDAMKTFQDKDSAIQEDDIAWIITVPAIWDAAAKQFMREAAQEAGISKYKLNIALEPEAASVYCIHLRVVKLSSDKTKTTLSTFAVGKRYIVLDAGGGTVDITVHEVVIDKETKKKMLKELSNASGGDWGGTRVDQAFLDFLSDVTGQDVISKFKERHIEDYIELMRNFEVKKRGVDPSSDSIVTLKIPSLFAKLVKELRKETLQEVFNKTVFANQVKLESDKLRVEAGVAKQFFETPIRQIVRHVKDLLQDPVNKGVDAILMVGGFSDSPMLKEAIRNNFPNLGLIVPNGAGLAVLKGAVIFGHANGTITERVSKYTYGVEAYPYFDHNSHPIEKKTLIDGELYCKDIFDVHVHEGERLVVGEAQTERSYLPIYSDQSSFKIYIYATKKQHPKYIDEDGCKKIGTVIVPVSGHGKGRQVTVKMVFGGTEIDVECTEVATGKITHGIVDFLPNV